MSDHPLPDDELLSSFLDGELTDDEGARLDARFDQEPQLRDRLAELRSAADLAATPVAPLHTGEREPLLTAALAATATATNVADLDAARTRREQRRTRLATAAAAVAALAIAVPTIRALSSDDTDSSADGSTTAEAIAPADETPDAGMAEADIAADLSQLDAPTADSAEDSAFAEESGGMSDVAPEETPEEAVPTARSFPAGLLGPDPGFDPFVDDLGDFSATEDLLAAVEAAWLAVATPPETELTTLPPDDGTSATTDFRAQALAFVDAYGGCGSALDRVVDTLPSGVVAVDYSIATVGETTFTAGLFLLADGAGVLQLIDIDGCVVLEPTILDAG